VYWDSCNWIGLINEDPNKIVNLRYVYDQAKKGEIEILTSTFALAEVFRLRCENAIKHLPEEKDQIFEDCLDQEFVLYVQVTRDIGRYARRLLRRTEGLKKPQDAIHLASAAMNNVDELHTFDGDHLLPLDGKIDRKDGTKLTICIPPIPSPIPSQGDLFEETSEQPATDTDAAEELANHEETTDKEDPVKGIEESISAQE